MKLAILYTTILSTISSSLVYLGVAASYHFLLIGFFVFMLFYKTNGVIKTTKKNPILKFFIYWTMYAAFSIIWAEGKKMATQYTYYIFLIYMYMCIFVQCLDSKERFFKAVRFMNLITLAACVVGIWEMVTGNHIVTDYLDDPDRIRIFKNIPGFTYRNPNDFAMFLFMLLPISFYEAIFSKTFTHKMIGLINIAGTILMVGVTNSRTVLICVILYTAIIVFKYLRMSIGKILIGGIMFVIAIQFIPGLNVAFETAVSDIATENLEASLVDEAGSGQTRIHLFLNSFIMMISSGGIGVGAGCHRLLMNSYSSQYYYTGRVSVAHNFLAEFLADYGIIMFGIMVYLLYGAAKRLRLISRQEDIEKHDDLSSFAYFLFLSLALFPIASVTMSSMIQMISLWTTFGIIAAYWNVYSNEQEKISQSEMNEQKGE